MCLKIDSTVKARKPDKDGYCVAWKVITIDNRPVMYPRNFEYRVGENCMNKESLTEKKCVFSFMTLRSYFIVIIMVSMGIALRHSSIPKQFLSILYNGIGLALFLSGLRYMRFFIKLSIN